MIPSNLGSDAEVPALTLTHAVLRGGAHGGRPALVDATAGRTLTYAELAEQVGSAAAGLAREGFGPGDVIALHLPDTPEFAVAAFGVLAAGSVPTPVRATATVAAMARQLTETGARALITWPVLADLALEAVKATDVERIFCFGDEPDVEPFANLLAGGAAPDVTIDPAAGAALLPYTRGTGGPAKGVRLTHRNLVASLLQLTGSGAVSGSDIVLSGIPFADVLGFSGALGPALHLGATVVTRSGTGRHDLLRTLQEHRVTLALLPPRMVEILAYDRAVPRYDLRSLRAVVSAGGLLRPETARACALRLGCPVRQAYGLTEGSGITHLNLRAAEEGTLDSVGRGLPWTRWTIRDPATGAERPAYQAGELLLRGPTAARSYVCAPILTRWLPTGDSAFADEHGRLFLMGRMDEADREPPADPDIVLAGHPAVAEAVVAPVPDPDIGLASHAFVILTDSVAVEDLLAYVNGHVPPYRRIHAVHPVEAIPRSLGGRVLRRVLIDRAIGRRPR